LRQWLREPLLHFLLLALLLYCGHVLLHPQRGGGARVIRVDRKALVDFMQYRSRSFVPGAFEKEFDALDAADRQALADDYVREEALLREARALGLEDGDYVIRQRLVQRLGFVVEDAAASQATLDDARLASWYDQHAEDYREPASYTFTHVFFDPALHGDAAAESLARQTLGQLQSRHAGFSDAARYGDRFPFLLNYVERTDDFVRSQFGGEFLAQLDAKPADAGQWRGPFRSAQGWHLVLMTARVPARLPPLAGVRERVLDDWKREQREAGRRTAIDHIVAGYRIERAW
jgi:hypothetical protein